MPRKPTEICEVTWEERYGTTTSGNLPTHKTKECISDTVDINVVRAEFPWVREDYGNFKYYHFKCPYATEAEIHYARNNDRNDPNYWNFELVMPINRASHTATGGLMIKHSRGSKHGWLCVDPVCPYYVTNNTNYFYV
jgi:hypothetical protein